jgi:two-component system, OmpR family, response regulator
MGKCVLIIEDEPNIIEAITYLLNHDGWSVAAHSDGADAIEVINRVAPDLLILDIMLPNRSGYDILQDLRAGAATHDLPVLMLTAKGQAKDREAAENFGADLYMTKPFSNKAMLDGVRELVKP